MVTLSSSVHNLAKSFHFDDINADSGHYEMFHNYGQSKLANILFTKELSNRYVPCRPLYTCFFSLYERLLSTGDLALSM